MNISENKYKRLEKTWHNWTKDIILNTIELSEKQRNIENVIFNISNTNISSNLYEKVKELKLIAK